MRLEQSINAHHRFEMFLDYEVGEAAQAYTLDKTTEWLGKLTGIIFGERTFRGIITQVSLYKETGGTFLKVSGYSYTYLLETEPHFASWNKTTLKDIVSELTSQANVAARIKPERTTPLEYECQYGESSFRFLQRLAQQHYEWFYFDGEELIFGKPMLPQAVALVYQQDLSRLDIGIQASAKASSSFSHRSDNNQTFSAESPNTPKGFGPLGYQAFEQSIKVFSSPGNQYSDIRVGSDHELQQYLEKKQQADAAYSHSIIAESDYLGLMVGDVVTIKSSVQVKGNQYKDEIIGSYIITEMMHYADEPGSYRCTFSAIPASVYTLPTAGVTLPVAEPQMATVVSNKDPQGHGRVQVRMNWQVKGMKTSWIRVLTPDAGSSDKVSSNRGFVFIPEEGDQVMIGFHYNDPNRPYVQGSLFNGKNAGGGGAGNNVKSLTTKSGVAVILDDSNGSVCVKDKAGNSFSADGSGNIAVDASKQISLNCGGSSLTLMEDGTIIIAGKELVISGETSLSLSSKEINSVAQDSQNISGMDVTVSGQKEVTVSGTAKATIDSMGTTTISGTIVKLN
ncbi:phage baseplate assembly protein V [Porphyromonas catoniae]|uniref:type VI secretion system Vgr family protein n=1 Tax=Porphyromonas catoniae TaxID=41976 RepID=UPI0028D39A96|nr:phage baseplate assembly protein V [Porphyromonas catoniae]